MASQLMNWLNNRWRPVPQVDSDDDDGMSYSSRLMSPLENSMVELRGWEFQPSSSSSSMGWQGGEGEGRPGPLSSLSSPRWKRGMVVVVCLLFVLVAMVTTGGNKEVVDPVVQGGGAPTAQTTTSTISTISIPSTSNSFPPATTLEFIFQHPHSAQAQALHWLEQHSERNKMPNWRKQQLLALVTLLMANCGDDMKQFSDDNKKSSECQWDVGFNLDCNADGQIRTWKNPTCGAGGGKGGEADFSGAGIPAGASASATATVAATRGVHKYAASRLPPQIGLLSHLTNLYLPHNGIASYVPTQLGLLTELTYLGLGMNQLRGPIPSEVGRLTLLTSLLWNDNQLYGTLPSQLGRLTALESFTASNNAITGSLPTQWIQGMRALRTIDLSKNRLHGSLPQGSWSSLSNLLLLRMDENHMTGSLPTTLGELTSLTGLILPHNQFTGSLPKQLGLLTKLEMGLLLGDNHFTGTIPKQLGQLTSLEELGLATNDFKGKLPSTELGKLTSLEQLSVHDNPKIKGKVFDSTTITQWPNMYILWLYNTSLTGYLPQEICDTFTSSSPSIKVDCSKVGCPDCASQWCKCMP